VVLSETGRHVYYEKVSGQLLEPPSHNCLSREIHPRRGYL
jgi:hypothetical protein